MKPVCFYHTPGHASRHPGTRAGLLRRASDQRSPRARGRSRRAKDCTGPVTADDLFEFDQDHYGGLAAVDTLARRAGVGAVEPRPRPLRRVSAALPGFWPAAEAPPSWRSSCTRAVRPERLASTGWSSRRASQSSGLTRRRLPFAQGAFDACVSQEALLHIAAKPAVLAECHRVLVRGGRLAFTDWIAFPSLGRSRARSGSGSGWRPRPCRPSTAIACCSGRSGFTNRSRQRICPRSGAAIVRERIELHRALRPQRKRALGSRAVPGIRPAPHVLRGARSKPASSAAGASRRLAERSAAAEAFQEILKPALDLLVGRPRSTTDAGSMRDRRRSGVPGHLRPDLAASVIDSQIEVHAAGRKAVVSRRRPTLRVLARVEEVLRAQHAVGDLVVPGDRLEIDGRSIVSALRDIGGEHRRRRAGHAA